MGDRIVFRHTDWTIRRGEHWVLIGPTGGGKTVLCRALGGEYPVVEGSIDYGFRAPADREPEQCIERLSFERPAELDGPEGTPVRWFSLDVEQSPLVSTVLSRNHVEGINPFEVVVRSRKDSARWTARARRVIGWVGVEPLMDRRLVSLSNGELRKILIARALMRNPKILILDDPFVGLDADSRRHLRAIFDSLIRRRAVTLILVSARPSEWPRRMTHLALIDRMRLVAAGPLAKMKRDPCVAQLLGERSALPDSMGMSLLARRERRSTPGRELVRFRAVTARWGKSVILDPVDWTVRAGESWVVTGPNGAGKSTLLSFIVGENPQVYANDIRVFGRRRGTGETVWELKRKIGWVSPEFHLGFSASLSGLETVLTGFFGVPVLREPPTSKQRTAAREEMRRLGIDRLSGRSFGSMSTGEQRMVLLARALVKKPRLLVLDEPCQGLDRSHRQRFIAAVDRLIRRGVTTLYVTHQPDEIPPSIHCALRLKNGRARRETL